jgi:Na+/melibiose symporter-like transporter
MSNTKEKTEIKQINWVIIGVWIVLLIIMWIVYGVFAPNLVLFIIALIITIAGPALNYGLLWYKIRKS